MRAGLQRRSSSGGTGERYLSRSLKTCWIAHASLASRPGMMATRVDDDGVEFDFDAHAAVSDGQLPSTSTKRQNGTVISPLTSRGLAKMSIRPPQVRLPAGFPIPRWQRACGRPKKAQIRKRRHERERPERRSRAQNRFHKRRHSLLANAC